MKAPTILHPKRKVLLVEPAAVSANVFSAYAGLPLLGPLYLGTLLRQAGFHVTVINEDLLGRRLHFNDLDADFLLLSCLTPTVERGYELASLFKRSNPEGKVVMGGPHVSFLQEEALRYADHVVTGEGESVITDLLKYGSSEPVVKGSAIEDLDALPFLDWSLLVNWQRLKMQPFMFSRGCPFSCSFCSVTAMFGRCYRTMSVERVLEEVDRAFLPRFFFYDDNFSANLKRTHEITAGLMQRANKISCWTAQVRADVARDENLIKEMAASKCSRVYVGFESANNNTLKELNKRQSMEDSRLAVRMFHKHGISLHGMFIFGADSDDETSIRDTAKFIQTERVDSIQYMILTPFPGTELYAKLSKENRILHKMWRFYDAMHVVAQPKNFAPHELQELALSSYEAYYNFTMSLKIGLETALSSFLRLGGKTVERFGAPSFLNAGLKLMGKNIIYRWRKNNLDYFKYLKKHAQSNLESELRADAA